MKSNYQILEQKLKNALNPSLLEIIDESGQHSDHYQKSDEYHISHAKIKICSDQFSNQSMIKCHQMVYKALNDEIRSGVLHAIKIEIIWPSV